MIPPAQEEMRDGQSVGAACTDPTGIGVCQMSQCAHLDYQHWTHRDASASPSPPRTHDCVLCMVPGASDGGSIDGGHTRHVDAAREQLLGERRRHRRRFRSAVPRGDRACSPGADAESSKIEAVGVHHLRPRGDEVGDEPRLRDRRST